MATDWKRVREDFETKRLSYAELARRYGCHPHTIRRRAKKEVWERGEKPNEVLKAHRGLLKGLRSKVGRELIEGFVKEPKDLKTGVDALLTIFEGERQAWGIGEVGCVIKPEETDHITKQMEDSTTPPGTGALMEGG